MPPSLPDKVTVGGDKGYAAKNFVANRPGNGAAICQGTSATSPVMVLRHDPLAPFDFEADGYTLLPGEEPGGVENPDAGYPSGGPRPAGGVGAR